MVKMLRFDSRDEWLEARANRIGGSEAASLIGLNPWQSNVDLWRIKTGRETSVDISEKPAVKYGAEAEHYLRGLFALDYPQYDVEYVENNMWLNDKYPFAHASLDGWLTDEQGRKGILEIKTTTIVNPAQKSKWENRIPDNYFCQVLWYMGVVEADFAILKAQLKWNNGEDIFCVTRHYMMERAEFEDDIKLLLQKGSEFSDYIQKDIEPPLILPNI